MLDYNVSVVSIDSGIECFERIRDELNNSHKAMRYNLSQLEEALNHKYSRIEAELNELYSQLNASEDDNNDTSNTQQQELLADIAYLQRKLSEIQDLKNRCSQLIEHYYCQASTLIHSVGVNITDGIREMANYLQKIASVESFDALSNSSTNSSAINPFSGEEGYAVAIIDSSKYPETAEHIDVAIRCGSAAVLTLDRENASINRAESLQGVNRRSDFDRDEWPMACFSEGGSGAHVFYLSASDNRGAGSSISHQLRNVPDGTRVRFRII